MAGVVNIAWLRKGGIGVVNRIGASSIWSWSIIFTLHWRQGDLEQLDGAAKAAFELLLMMIDQYQQIEQSERFIQLRRGNYMLFSIK